MAGTDASDTVTAGARPQPAAAPERFYEDVHVDGDGDAGFGVRLDRHPLKTPAGTALRLPGAALARAVAGEWRAQGEKIDRAAMPMTGLANAAVDRVSAAPADYAALVARYAEADVVCYWADTPADLVERQRAVWQPLLAWLEGETGAKLRVATGVVPVSQPDTALAAVHEAAASFDPFPLTALVSLADASRSAVIALAAARGRLDAAQAFDAAHLDELHQAERWGEDHEAARARAAIRTAMETALRFLALCREDD